MDQRVGVVKRNLILVFAAGASLNRPLERQIALFSGDPDAEALRFPVPGMNVSLPAERADQDPAAP